MKKDIGPIGCTIIGVEWLTQADAEAQGIGDNYNPQFNPVQKILLSNGTYITALADPEGNGAGFIVLGGIGGGSYDLRPKGR